MGCLRRLQCRPQSRGRWAARQGDREYESSGGPGNLVRAAWLRELEGGKTKIVEEKKPEEKKPGEKKMEKKAEGK